jgi:hypothetical protein
MRPSLPVLEPTSKGVALALWSVALATIGGAFFLGAVPPASPQLLQSLATIGAILMPAYAIEVVWLSTRNGSASRSAPVLPAYWRSPWRCLAPSTALPATQTPSTTSGSLSSSSP